MWYLLSFDGNDKERILWKLPKGWVKLGRGLGCCLSCPGETYQTPIPITIMHVLAGLSTSRIKWDLERLDFICAATDLQHVILVNNVKMDKVEALLEVEDLAEEAASMKKEVFSFDFIADGYSLEFTRRQVCMMCSDDNHCNLDCEVCQKLASASHRGWSFINLSNDAQRLEKGSQGETVIIAADTAAAAQGTSEGAVTLDKRKGKEVVAQNGQEGGQSSKAMKRKEDKNEPQGKKAKKQHRK